MNVHRQAHGLQSVGFRIGVVFLPSFGRNTVEDFGIRAAEWGAACRFTPGASGRFEWDQRSDG